MPILVTGATGFIGKNLVSLLLRKGYKVKALVRGNRQLEVSNPALEIFNGDLTQMDTLSGIEENCNEVVHCAGVMGKWGIDDSILNNININAGINLLKRFKGKNIRRFLHISAAGVTGPLIGKIADERYACKPATAYEKSKLIGEQKILEYSKKMTIPLTVVRPTFTYGPGDHHKFALFKAVNDRHLPLVDSGKSVIHPVFIDDLVFGILLALKQGISGEVYILGGEQPVTKKELIYTIADILGKKKPLLNIPHSVGSFAATICEFLSPIFNVDPIFNHSRLSILSDNFGYSIKKAKEELGYNPKTTLREGLIKTITYYKKSRLL